MKYYQAQDTFVAGFEDGTERVVTKGEALPETHELVKRDLAAGSKDRTPLFRLMDTGEEEKPPAARKARSSG